MIIKKHCIEIHENILKFLSVAVQINLQYKLIPLKLDLFFNSNRFQVQKKTQFVFHFSFKYMGKF